MILLYLWLDENAISCLPIPISHAPSPFPFPLDYELCTAEITLHHSVNHFALTYFWPHLHPRPANLA